MGAATSARRTSHCFVIVGSGALALAGCRSQAFVAESDAAHEQTQTICSLKADCACDEYPWLSVAECTDEYQAPLVLEYDTARAAGLTYDGHCVGERILTLLEGGCTPTDATPEDSAQACQKCLPYHGNAKLGEPCRFVTHRGLSTCAQGLVCNGVVCHDPCIRFNNELEVGDLCHDGVALLGQCSLNLVCDVGFSNLCIELPKDGEPCLFGQCADGHYCDEHTCTTGYECGHDDHCAVSKAAVCEQPVVP